MTKTEINDSSIFNVINTSDCVWESAAKESDVIFAFKNVKSDCDLYEVVIWKIYESYRIFITTVRGSRVLGNVDLNYIRTTLVDDLRGLNVNEDVIEDLENIIK